MTTPSATADDGPRRLLEDSRLLAQRVRATQRATWFPLLVFAAVTFAAIPVYRYVHPSLTCRSGQGGIRVCLVYTSAGLVYWPIALVIAYALIATFYVRRARARGVGTRVNRYVVAGVILALLMGFVSVWTAMHPPIGDNVLGLHLRGARLAVFAGSAGPATAIGLALLFLAVVERSWGLVVLTVAYLAVALSPAVLLHQISGHLSVWAFLPRLLLEGGLLLLGAIAFALLQRPWREIGR
jgi:hypothetical protein